MNIEKAKDILSSLWSNGARTIALCPGARNAPFVELLQATQNFEVISFYDERSAGFFALGRARRDGSPCAVLTTSGTAVAELLPAVIEAYYSQTALIVVSSDRPKRLRGTGAPQAINQAHIFQNFVQEAWDLEVADDTPQIRFLAKPYHINLCFDEPLIDGPVTAWEPRDLSLTESSLSETEIFANRQLEAPLILLGALRPEEARSVEKQLSSVKAPVFAEAASGLKNSTVLSQNLLAGGEKLVSKMLKSGSVKSVLRIGDVPLGRFWRDLDQMDIPILSFSNKPWAGTDKSEVFCTSLENLSLDSLSLAPWDFEPWLTEGKSKQSEIGQLVAEFPLSEAAFFADLSKEIAPDDFVYIGNSLPVRLWDLLDTKQRDLKTNRGANGIDGQISSAFGAMKSGENHWVLLGDLTTLYDFSGLWVSEYLKSQEINVNLVVVNNGGGQIFSRIFKNPLFRNEHGLNFKSFAEAWNWDYTLMNQWPSQMKFKTLQLLEYRPDRDQSQMFWERYDHLWKS